MTAMTEPSRLLRLHNSLGRSRQDFTPLEPDHVRMYVCGPTVYDHAHIGNARPVVVFDVLFRLLQRLYPKVTYVRNITDIDDKIIEAAQKNNESIQSLTARMTTIFHDDMAALDALPPSLEPRATAHIDAMLAMIGDLLEKGHAYAVDGHVFFDVPSYPDYGQLSGRDRYQMIAGARVDVCAHKKDPADFVLWKPSENDQPGWDSPWGRGRPGWHIECSAMSGVYLGPCFDIHGGGLDLVFPHHENEIAQSCCAHDRPSMAQFWLHNGYVALDGEKMSKSTGNVVSVRGLLDQGWPGEAIRLTLLSAHYRQPLDFSTPRLAASRAQLDRLYGALRAVDDEDTDGDTEDFSDSSSPPEGVWVALLDDLNVPAALACLHEAAHALNKTGGQDHRLAASLRSGGKMLGLLNESAQSWFQRPPAQSGAIGEGTPAADTAWIEKQIAERLAARQRGDYECADRIRDALNASGVALEDSPQGTSWRWKQ